MKKRNILCVLFFLVSFCNTREQPTLQSNRVHELCGDSFKIWNAQTGNNVIFYKKGFLREFNNVEGRRVYAKYGDFLIDTIAFHIDKDTLITEIQQKSILLKVSNDTLILKDLTKIWGKDTLMYFRAGNQTDLPSIK